MEKKYFSVEKDGFYGCYYPHKTNKKHVLIAMVGDAVDDHMAVSFVKWAKEKGCGVLAMSPAKKDYSHHNLPLERFEAAIKWLKNQGVEKIAIAGASTTGMLALIVACHYEEISLTLALTPSDFVMEGYYKGKKDGAKEWPGDGESTVSYKGKPLPYLPYADRHPDYWNNVMAYSKETKNLIASRKLFQDSEKASPLTEEQMIKVENIRGKVVFIGAEDDSMWDTCRYIRRMRQRLTSRQASVEAEYFLYDHGTHFVFPDGMMRRILPLFSGLLVKICFKAARDFPKECKETRIDIDRNLSRIIKEWMAK